MAYDNFLIDKRVVDRNIKKGLVDPDELKVIIEALPDTEANCVSVSVDGDSGADALDMAAAGEEEDLDALDDASSDDEDDDEDEDAVEEDDEDDDEDDDDDEEGGEKPPAKEPEPSA